jgi:YD repeat-containing protein
MKEIREYDTNGNLTYCRYSNGYEVRRKYDNRGNKIHFRDSNGYEVWYEYDDRGNMIHYRDSNGHEEWSEYDERGNMIHYRDSNQQGGVMTVGMYKGWVNEATCRVAEEMLDDYEVVEWLKSNGFTVSDDPAEADELLLEDAVEPLAAHFEELVNDLVLPRAAGFVRDAVREYLTQVDWEQIAEHHINLFLI